MSTTTSLPKTFGLTLKPGSPLYPPAKVADVIIQPAPSPVFDPTYSAVPDSLKKLNRWLAFEVTWNPAKKKFDKKPVNSRGVHTNDPETGEPFETMRAFANSRKNVVLGLYIDAPYIGIDADDCRDPMTGTIDPNVNEIVHDFNSYAEASPSGTGVRIIVMGKKPGDSCRKGAMEIYSHKRAVTITGLHIEGTQRTVNDANVAVLYERMVNGEFFSEKQRTSYAKAKTASDGRIESNSNIITTGLQVLMAGEVRSLKPFEMADGLGTFIFYDSPSEAVQGLLTRLAIKHKSLEGDERKDAMREEFEASELLAQLNHWSGPEGKWTRLGDTEIERALKFVNAKATTTHALPNPSTQELGHGGLSFKYPAVKGTPFDFVIGPALGAVDGWFPRGDPSLIGGPSGSNKSTFMTDLLEAQKKRECFLGHETFGLPYLILMADRGNNAHIRTANRMRYDPNAIPIEFLPTVWGAAALRAILQKIEGRNPIPAVVFVEGCDTLVENASKMEIVAPFMEGLQRIASHYHIAIIGSVGAPKQRVGEGYAATRDNIIGSVAWSRKSETIACIKYVKGDDTDQRRKLVVLPRNAAAEKFDMKLEAGRLVVDGSAVDENKPKLGADIEWYRTQAGWFTPEDVRAAWKVSRAQAYRSLAEAFTKHILKTKQKVSGGARQYRWNDNATNPYSIHGTENLTEGD